MLELQQSTRGTRRSPGAWATPRARPARPDAGLLICPWLYIFRKYESLTHFETRGIPAQTNPHRVRQGILPSPKFGAQETLRKGHHHGLSALTAFRSHLVLGMAPWGSHTSPDMAPPSQGLVGEDWDGVQTKVGFQLAGKLALLPTPPLPCLAGIPCRLPGSFPSRLRCLFTCCCCKKGVRALWRGGGRGVAK